MPARARTAAKRPARARGPAVLAHLAPGELAALIRYARANGRFWKSRLLDAWSSGRDAHEPDGPSLRRVRNTLGPSPLGEFALAALEAELSARGAAA